MKQVEITEQDIKQATIVIRLLQEAKYEIKGEAIGMAAQAMNWLMEFARRMKEAKEVEPAAEEPKRTRK